MNVLPTDETGIANTRHIHIAVGCDSQISAGQRQIGIASRLFLYQWLPSQAIRFRHQRPSFLIRQRESVRPQREARFSHIPADRHAMVGSHGRVGIPQDESRPARNTIGLAAEEISPDIQIQCAWSVDADSFDAQSPQHSAVRIKAGRSDEVLAGLDREPARTFDMH